MAPRCVLEVEEERSRGTKAMKGKSNGKNERPRVRGCLGPFACGRLKSRNLVSEEEKRTLVAVGQRQGCFCGYSLVSTGREEDGDEGEEGLSR